jgi:hypothetical protein
MGCQTTIELGLDLGGEFHLANALVSAESIVVAHD